MMSLNTIREISEEAAARAARDNKVPLLVEAEDMDNLAHHLRYMPFLGDHVPEGYELTTKFFVDGSGFGHAGEGALTQKQFCSQVEPGYSYAVIESGQFQIYIGEFIKRGE